MMLRRSAFACLFAGSPTIGATAVADDIAWAEFRSRYLVGGRTVDTGNGNISHSEGQGWSLLFAERAGDRGSFEAIWSWTTRHLGRKHDALHSWRWRPDQRPAVDDPNNASDGDLYIAWALLRAGRRWSRPDYTAAADAIGRDLQRLCVRQIGPRLVLLPGAAGFERPDSVTLNPSYYVFPALTALAALQQGPWATVAADGIALLRRALFGRWRLPPDWLRLPRQGDALAPAAGWPTRFSFDAVRIPLFLAWSGHDAEPVVQHALEFWDQGGPGDVRPAWVDVTSGETAPYAASPGMQAIAQFVRGARAGNSVVGALPSPSLATDYYGAALTMLARLARQDRGLAG